MGNDIKLYIVEFGSPDVGNYITFGGRGFGPLFVVAKSYDEAAEKAIQHAVSKADSGGVIDSDGSLTIKQDDEIQVKSVKLACNEVVW